MGKVIETTDSIDYTTGEIKSSTVVKRFKGEEPNYVKLYLEDISYLHRLPATAGALLHELLKYITYGTQEVVLNSVVKKRIAEATGMNIRTVDNRLQELVKSGIISRIDIGTFMLNPYLFGKGDWKTINELRNKNIHLSIVYDKETGLRSIRGNLV